MKVAGIPLATLAFTLAWASDNSVLADTVTHRHLEDDNMDSKIVDLLKQIMEKENITVAASSNLEILLYPSLQNCIDYCLDDSTPYTKGTESEEVDTAAKLEELVSSYWDPESTLTAMCVLDCLLEPCDQIDTEWCKQDYLVQFGDGHERFLSEGSAAGVTGFTLFVQYAARNSSPSKHNAGYFIEHHVHGLPPNCKEGDGCILAVMDAASCSEVTDTTVRLLEAEYVTNDDGFASGLATPKAPKTYNGKHLSLRMLHNLPRAFFGPHGELLACDVSIEPVCGDEEAFTSCSSDLTRGKDYFHALRITLDDENGKKRSKVFSFGDSPDLHMTYRFEHGLEPGCKDCQIAVMDATSCEEVLDPSIPTGHLYDSKKFASTPWASATYEADENGRGVDFFTLDTGLSMDDYANRPLAFFDSNGSVMHCSLLTYVQCVNPDSCDYDKEALRH